MSATYTNTLLTNLDWVRFLVGDIDVTAGVVQLQDEEIAAVLAEETATGKALKYFAAATCLSTLFARWTNSGKGVLEKQVLQLRIRRGVNESAVIAMERRICELRSRGAFLLTEVPRVLKAH